MVRKLWLECLLPRLVLAANIFYEVSDGLFDFGDAFVGQPSDFTAPTWHNVAFPLDVNGDTFVSPIDALLGINRINVEADPTPLGWPDDEFTDVNADGTTSPIDILLIINRLNEQDSAPRAGDVLSEFTALIDVFVEAEKIVEVNAGQGTTIFDNWAATEVTGWFAGEVHSFMAGAVVHARAGELETTTTGDETITVYDGEFHEAISVVDIEWSGALFLEVDTDAVVDIDYDFVAGTYTSEQNDTAASSGSFDIWAVSEQGSITIFLHSHQSDADFQWTDSEVDLSAWYSEEVTSEASMDIIAEYAVVDGNQIATTYDSFEFGTPGDLQADDYLADTDAVFSAVGRGELSLSTHSAKMHLLENVIHTRENHRFARLMVSNNGLSLTGSALLEADYQDDPLLDEVDLDDDIIAVSLTARNNSQGDPARAALTALRKRYALDILFGQPVVI